MDHAAEVIVSTFIEQDRHLTAEELLAMVREVDQSVSAATVYRTMNLLVDTGMAAKRNFTGGSAAFELLLGKDHHHHLIDVRERKHHRIPQRGNGDLARFGGRTSRLQDLLRHKIEVFGTPIDQLRGTISFEYAHLLPTVFLRAACERAAADTQQGLALPQLGPIFRALTTAGISPTHQTAL